MADPVVVLGIEIIIGPVTLSRRRSSANPEVVVVQGGVEQQEKAPLGLVAPHRIIGKHDHVAAPDRNVHDCRLSDKIRPARQHPAHQQILLVRSESEYDSRAHLGRR